MMFRTPKMFIVMWVTCLIYPSPAAYDSSTMSMVMSWKSAIKNTCSDNNASGWALKVPDLYRML